MIQYSLIVEATGLPVILHHDSQAGYLVAGSLRDLLDLIEVWADLDDPVAFIDENGKFVGPDSTVIYQIVKQEVTTTRLSDDDRSYLAARAAISRDDDVDEDEDLRDELVVEHSDAGDEDEDPD